MCSLARTLEARHENSDSRGAPDSRLCVRRCNESTSRCRACDCMDAEETEMKTCGALKFQIAKKLRQSLFTEGFFRIELFHYRVTLAAIRIAGLDFTLRQFRFEIYSIMLYGYYFFTVRLSCCVRVCVRVDFGLIAQLWRIREVLRFLDFHSYVKQTPLVFLEY